MTRDPIYDVMKEHSKTKAKLSRTEAMAEAVARDDGGWTKHTEFHWSRVVAGKKLDYWPSRRKFQWQGKVRHGDVYNTIRAHS